MSIYITGDTHGDFKRFSKKQLSKLAFKLNKEDYVIISGDFGLLWEHDKEFEYNLNWLGSLPFKILWIQGNHENYNMIAEYPLEKWHGGNVRHIVRDKIILLERGQVFNINGKTFFTFGGAESNDIQGGILNREESNFKIKKNMFKKKGLNFRILNESWWEAELPTQKELDTGLYNLGAYDFNVDYIITHCAPLSLQNKLNISEEKKKVNNLTQYLEFIERFADFKHWYFGHYHDDLVIDNNHTLVYKNIIKIA